jgi:hypothetical protein
MATKTMTVAEAAKTWVDAKRTIDEAQPRLNAAAAVLKAHFRETGRSSYKGLIGYARTIRRRLDTAKVRNELFDRLDEFEIESPVESLSLLKR